MRLARRLAERIGLGPSHTRYGERMNSGTLLLVLAIAFPIFFVATIATVIRIEIARERNDPGETGDRDLDG